MPLPRFLRLPQDKQDHILTVAGERFAADGLASASYNEILVQAGISKASAYQYFDSRADLLDAVLHRVAARAREALGEWKPCPGVASHRAQWVDAVGRFTSLLLSDPTALALTQHCVGQDFPEGPYGWMSDVLLDGQKLGIVRTDLPVDLLVSVSLGVSKGIDSWSRSRMNQGAVPDPGLTYSLMAGMWRGDV